MKKEYKINIIKASDDNGPGRVNKSNSIEELNIKRASNARNFGRVENGIKPIFMNNIKIKVKIDFSKSNDVGDNIVNIKTRKIPINKIIICSLNLINIKRRSEHNNKINKLK